MLWCYSHIELILAVDSGFSERARRVQMCPSKGGQADTGRRVLRVVSVPDAFLFFVDAERYTGEFATSLTDLLKKLDRVPLESVEFHFQRGDFEKWVGRTLGDEELADKLRQIDRRVRGQELKAAIKETIRKRLGELGQAVQACPKSP